MSDAQHTLRTRNPAGSRSYRAGGGKSDRLLVDFSACRHLLIWANERVIERQYLESRATAARQTVAWLIERGSVRVDYADGRAEADEGQWLFLRAAEGVQHFAQGTRVVSIRFELLVGDDPMFPRETDVVVEHARHPGLRKAAMRMVKLLRQHAGDEPLLELARSRIPLVANLEIEEAFLGWLLAYVRVMLAAGQSPRQRADLDARVARTWKRVEEHPMARKFSEAELARDCGLSGQQLARLYRRDAGLTPFQHYEQRRIELARQALTETSMTMKAIGFDLGFSSQQHFSNWFRERVGISPRTFRRSESGKESET